MRPSMVIVYIIALAIVVGGEMRIRGKVRKRNNAHRRHRAVLPPCNFNESLIEDEWALMEAIGKSKFIFTGKVLTVKKYRSMHEIRGKRSNLYRVYMRRILKGDENELRVFVKQEGPTIESLSGSTMMLERLRARESCSPSPRPRLSAIFLSDGVFSDSERGPTPRLRLLTDPVPLTLYHLDRINAAVKDLHYQPRPPAPEEACEKTFCRWGAECVSLGDGRAHCACPTSCPSSAAPVCSTAGRTYRNHCFLRKEACERRLNLRIKHEGECEAGDPCSAVTCPTGARCIVTYGQPECRCPRSCQRRKTVCGSDGHEYPSACHLDKHACDNQLNITIKYHGKCDPCSEHECADGGICQLNEVRAPVCRCGPPCDLIVRPGSAVCGSDYNDYVSECALRRESCRTKQELSIAYRGECASAQHPCESVKCGVRERCTLDARGVAVCGCGPACDDAMRPVCGSDDRTYDNPCLLARTACLDNRDIRVAYMGACGIENPCARASCPKIW